MFSIKALEGIQYEQNRIYGYRHDLGSGLVRIVDEFAGCKRITGWAFPIAPIYYWTGNKDRFLATYSVLFGASQNLANIIEQMAAEANKEISKASSLAKDIRGINIGKIVEEVKKTNVTKTNVYFSNWTKFRETLDGLKNLYSKLYTLLETANRQRADYYDVLLTNSFEQSNAQIKEELKEYSQYEKPKSPGIFDWIADLGKTAKFLTYAIPIGIGVYLIVPILSKKKER